MYKKTPRPHGASSLPVQGEQKEVRKQTKYKTFQWRCYWEGHRQENVAVTGRDGRSGLKGMVREGLAEEVDN